MAITNYFVDPSINANSGTGTIGDPFGDLQYALDTVTRDSTNGDQFNIKAGTAEVLTGTLDFSTYGTPANTAPLLFAGYTSAADDGGIGIIDGDGLYKIATLPSYTHARDMELRNVGSNQMISGHVQRTSLLNCILHGCTGSTYGIYGIRLYGCHLYDIGSSYMVANTSAFGSGFFQGPTNTCSNSMGYLFDNLSFIGNVFVNTVDTARGIFGHNQSNWMCFGNSLLMNGGDAIHSSGGSANAGGIFDNLIEGAATGIYSAGDQLVAGNAVFNSSTADYNGGILQAGNESLSASPFEKTGAATWANAKEYFAPESVVNIRTGAYTSIDGVKGAIAFPSQSVVSPQLHPLG